MSAVLVRVIRLSRDRNQRQANSFLNYILGYIRYVDGDYGPEPVHVFLLKCTEWGSWHSMLVEAHVLPDKVEMGKIALC